MAIYKRDIVDINLETGNIHRSFLKHSIGYLDQAADHFGIRVLRNGEPVDLTGVTVQGIFMPPQGNPIAITTGNIIEGNVAEVVLPQACYNYDGQFCLSIKLVDATNAITGTMRIVDGMVDNTHASGTVAPTETVPTYQEILSVYADMVTALVTVDELDDEVSDLKSAFDSNRFAVNNSEIDRNYTVEKIINQLASNPTNNSSFGSAPYSPMTSLEEFIVTKVKAYIVTPGYFHVGVYNGEIVEGNNYDASKASFFATATFTETGVQEVPLDIPVFVGKNQKLIYGIKNVDTAGMKYRGTGTTDVGFFTVNSSGKFATNQYACGVDFTCKKFFGTNIFDTKEAIYGYYTNDDGKQTKSSSPIGTTGFIYIGCFNELYICDPSGTSSSYKGAFYNDKKQYVSGISLTSAQKTAGTVISIPSGAMYVKLSFVQGYESSYLICGNPSNNKPEKGFDASVNYPKTMHDVFTTAGATNGVYIDGSGVIHEASTASVTDYIDIEGLSNPVRIIANWSAGFHCACFNASKTCIDGIDIDIQAGIPIEWSLPDGAKYVRISYKTSQSGEIQTYMFTNKELVSSKGKSYAPVNGYENFTYSVPVGIANNDTTATTLQDSADVGTDRGLIVFPSSYSANGKPTRLLICQPGTSGHITSATTTTQNTVIPADIACAEGFACLEVNGTPGVESTVGSNGNPVFLRCILAAYRYVTEKYNIATDGVFVTGYSQGSLCVMQIVNSGLIPVLGAALYGPDLDLWKIEYTYKSATVKEKICDEFGFAEKTASPLVVSLNLGFSEGDTVTEPSTYSAEKTVPGNHEKAYILNNIEKWAGYDPMTTMYGNGDPGMLYSIWSKYDADPATGEDELYNGNILLPCPVKLFVGTSDAVTTLKYSKWFQRMAVNGGSKCDLRIYNGIDHSGYKTGTDAITVTTKDGQSVSTRVDVWEGLLFFRKFNS